MQAEHYLGILLEDLYSKLQLIAESTVNNKKEIAAQMIFDFYLKHKDTYQISSVEEVERELDKIKQRWGNEREI